MKDKFYITTPIYYVNAAPHIGHAYTTIAADTLARYMRLRLDEKNPGDKVWFLTGTDEHGQKIQKAADAQGLSPQKYVDEVVGQFKQAWQGLNISYNDFIRTTEERHRKVVTRFMELLYANKDIYEDTYEGWYCTPCETFWTKLQATDNLCPDCKRPVEFIREKNYFFRLSQYQEKLISYIEQHDDFIQPIIRRNEVLSFLRGNTLSDLCISRPKERLSWGIPLPFSPEHVTYVWFDALINYISAVGSFDDAGKYVSQWWRGDVRKVHLIGKDILRHHAIYWPIMLMALEIPLPDTIFAHGWWLTGDTKMSKSRGNVVSPFDIARDLGIDTVRYFLLRDVPFGLDGSFSLDAVIKRYNSDLANDLGNLLYRTLTMVEKYCQGQIPSLDIGETAFDEAGENIKAKIKGLKEEVAADIESASFNFSIALEKIWVLINLTNKYVEETKPWNLSKENKTNQLHAFLRLLIEVLRSCGRQIAPCMPATAQSIEQQVGGERISKGAPLFPRIDTSKETHS